MQRPELYVFQTCVTQASAAKSITTIDARMGDFSLCPTFQFAIRPVLRRILKLDSLREPLESGSATLNDASNRLTSARETLTATTDELADAIARHNARRPDRPVLYLNYAATDPALTGERCSYWHFRVEADTAMKVHALVDFLAGQPELRKVYLLNQDYAHGQQVARHFREAVAERLPELEIVGDELHPPFQMRDFQAQIQRIHQFNVTRMERYLVACYAAEDEAHFRPHRDNTTKGTAHRRFAVSINLSADFDGGEICFPEYGMRSYKPAPGAAVIFSCSLLHAVTKVTRGRRYAFLPFLYDEAAAQVREQNLQYVAEQEAADRN